MSDHDALAGRQRTHAIGRATLREMKERARRASNTSMNVLALIESAMAELEASVCAAPADDEPDAPLPVEDRGSPPAPRTPASPPVITSDTLAPYTAAATIAPVRQAPGETTLLGVLLSAFSGGALALALTLLAAQAGAINVREPVRCLTWMDSLSAAACSALARLHADRTDTQPNSP